jgi:HSP20 family protein
MALLHWSSEQDMLSLRDQVIRFIDELFDRTAREQDTWGFAAWMPLVDTYETDDAVVLQAELPGFSKDDFSLEVKHNTLILQGERRQEAEVKEESYHRRECAYGAFERSFLLPATVDQDGVRATYKDGVLEVRLPKTESAKAQRIAMAG